MEDNPNIVFIVFDTLRKDVLSVYGGNANTPNIDMFAKDSVVYKNAIAPAPWTVPSHMSFFTGLYPREHGMHEDYDTGNRNLLEKIHNFKGDTFIRDLFKNGYNTIGFSANPWISSRGFDRDFNSLMLVSSFYATWEEHEVFEKSRKYGTTNYNIALNLIIKRKFTELAEFYKIYKRLKLKWRISGYPIKKGAEVIVNDINSSSYETPFFMFINFMEVHDPVTTYELREPEVITNYLDLFKIRPLSQNVIERIRKGYVTALHYADSQFGVLLKFLKETHHYDNTLIILTSDHGQALKDPQRYSYYGHGTFLSDEIITVPLIIKYPNNKKFMQKIGYQSLTGLPGHIKDVIEGKNTDSITKNVSFSESFGFPDNIKKSRALRKNLKDLDLSNLKKTIGYPRKAVFKNGYKLVINGLDGKVEEFTFNKERVDPKDKMDVFKDLLEELYIFKGSEHFVLPEF